MKSRKSALGNEGRNDDLTHMRCLHCGKELALLKRWTGGGEFCSDAHRQLYQEEYNKLALNRLLQAKPTQPKAPVEAKVAEPQDPKCPGASKPAALPPEPTTAPSSRSAPRQAAAHPEKAP